MLQESLIWGGPHWELLSHGYLALDSSCLRLGFAISDEAGHTRNQQDFGTASGILANLVFMKQSLFFILALVLCACNFLLGQNTDRSAVPHAQQTAVSKVPAAQLQQYRFNYKGFATKINDDAVDENGNHLLDGEIHAVEMIESKRDTAINRIFNLKGVSYDDDPRGLMIMTDKDYNVLKIEWGYIGKRVEYDFAKKHFIIGAMKFDYIRVGKESFSAWQPVIVQTDLTTKFDAYFILKPYSCILVDMVLEGDEILVFSRSKKNSIGNKSQEKAEVMRVSTAKCHRDSARPWINALDVITNVETPYDDLGDIHLSSTSKVDGTYIFATFNLDQFEVKLRHHLYQFNNEQLTELPNLLNYIQAKYQYPGYIVVLDFLANPSNEYFIITHAGASSGKLLFSKTDKDLKAIISKEVGPEDYAENNKLLALSNGNIVLVAVNATKTWSYHLYDPKMELIQEIKSTFSEDYDPILLKETSGHSVECIFNVHHVEKKDCVLEVVEWD